ncbi:MAG: hypothetical protein IPO67_13590 [Deltaproteobacteria bacterium]|nr:hypothetical protein [Deltaproteobacteria bacterium]MBK9369291.1 hypothetical protein [Deltaproteobacteria bacterium]MBK9646161.1 hypothetical protein [Deltaproteobacteria bacterium]
MSTARKDLSETALRRWELAVQARGAEGAAQEALDDHSVLDRYGWQEPRGRVLEILKGVEEIRRWLSITPVEVTMAAEGDVVVFDDGWAEVRYSVRLVDYVNGGLWRFLPSDDGKIRHIEHRPDPLPAEWRKGIPPGKRLS